MNQQPKEPRKFFPLILPPSLQPTYEEWMADKEANHPNGPNFHLALYLIKAQATGLPQGMTKPEGETYPKPLDQINWVKARANARPGYVGYLKAFADWLDKREGEQMMAAYWREYAARLKNVEIQ